ncbi:MAG TPA: diguanylate cyclase, partial [Solirubrobacteraceae bacterium]|nr:diguanylate cyclase [Solirubrobacteraceae bacterium]
MDGGDELRRVLDGALDAVVACDQTGAIVGWNRAAQAMFGWAKEEVLGRKVWETIVTPEDRPRAECALRLDPDAFPPRPRERSVLDRDGRRLAVEASVFATRLNGCVVLTAFVRDVSDRKRAERLRDTEHGLSRVLVGARSERDVIDRCLPLVGGGLGWPRAEAWVAGEAGPRCVGRWSAEAGLEEPSGEPAAELVERAFARATIEQDPHEQRVAVPILAGGCVVCVVALQAPSRDVHPDELAALAVMAEQAGQFADRRRTERRLETETAALAAVARASRRLSVATASAETRQALCDAALEACRATIAFLAEPEEDGDALVVTATAGRVPREPGLPRRLGPGTAVHRVHDTGVPFFSSDTSSDPRASSASAAAAGIMGALLQPIRGSEAGLGVLAVAWSERVEETPAQMRTLLGMLADEAAIALPRADAYTGLVTAARTDPLTGLANLRAWDEALSRELARATRSGRPFSVVMLDFDGLKLINDREGHQAGDRALRTAVAAWQDALRETDVLARVGGDEFGVALPDCDVDGAELLGERLRTATAQGLT